MRVIFTEKEVSTTEELLKNIGLESLELAKIMEVEGTCDITTDMFNTPLLEEFEGPIGHFKCNHFLADGSDCEEYELYLDDEFIVDIIKIYGAGAGLGFSLVKTFWTQYKLILKPIIESFTAKWQKVFDDYTQAKRDTTDKDDEADINVKLDDLDDVGQSDFDYTDDLF